MGRKNKYKQGETPGEAIVPSPINQPSQVQPATANVPTTPIQQSNIPQNQPGLSTSKKPVSSAKGREQEQDDSLKKPIDLAAIGDTIMAICPKKPSGTMGKKFQIETNFVKLNLARMIRTAYHYDVEVTPDRPRKLIINAFYKFMKQNLPQNAIAYDGAKSAYSAKKLNLKAIKINDIKIDDPATLKEKTFKIAIKETKNLEIDMKVLVNYSNISSDETKRALQCIDIVLKTAFRNLNGVKVKNSIYIPPSKQVDMGDNFEMWTGLFQSVMLCKYPMLNIDIAYKGFPMQRELIGMIQNIDFRADLNRKLDSRTIYMLKDQLQGLSITYCPPQSRGTQKLFKFLDIKEAAADLKFKNSDGKLITVKQYFDSIKCPIKFPYLPCLHVGRPDRNIYLPVEFCRVSGGQAVMKKYTSNQTKFMVKYCSCNTVERKKRILEEFKKVNHNQTDCIKEFNIEVNHDFEQIIARVIDVPTLAYNDKFTPRPGEWRLQRESFAKPAKLDQWVILNIDDRTLDNDVMQFGKNVMIQLRNRHVEVAPHKYDRGNINRLEDILKNYVQQKMQIVIVVMANNTYERVKTIAEVNVGCLTQCVQAKTIKYKCNDASTGANIALKINTKLGGENHSIHRDDRIPTMRAPFMLIGADVTHPSPDQKSIPSVVGFTASFSFSAFPHSCQIRYQDPKCEMIQDMEEMVHQQLIEFKQKNQNRLPMFIFYYRDGVSEGQFQQVRRIELQAINNAVQRLGDPVYKPKIIFIVVQKRHHTRFFPGNSNIAGNDRQLNVPPGTIVDDHITQPFESQFYLLSHLSPLGTARPTKYCVLHDDANISMDDLEKLSYALCYMCTRCNRSISYPATTYYAHLAAARGRAYIKDAKINMNNLKLLNNTYKIHPNILSNNPMFFV